MGQHSRCFAGLKRSSGRRWDRGMMQVSTNPPATVTVDEGEISVPEGESLLGPLKVRIAETDGANLFKSTNAYSPNGGNP